MICSPSEQFDCQINNNANANNNNNNECISWSFVCDGIAHCSNKADEDCDMCTNDLYQCKDLSRINCTRACTTLGYIPCKNYMDTKICASVVRALQSRLQQQQQGNGAKSGAERPGRPAAPALSSSFLENIKNLNRKAHDANSPTSSTFFNSETVFFSVIGLFFVLSLVVLLVVFGLLYVRFRRARKRMPLRNAAENQIVVSGRDGLLAYPLSSSPSASFSYPGSPAPKPASAETIEDPAALAKTISTPAAIYSSSKRARRSTSAHRKQQSQQSQQPHELVRSESILLDSFDELKAGAVDDTDDFQMYSEPPPPYKLSKYFPRVDPSTLRASSAPRHHQFETAPDDAAHVYENLDDLQHQHQQQESARGQQRTRRGGRHRHL